MHEAARQVRARARAAAATAVAEVTLSPLALEIVEGPGAGVELPLRESIVIGRGKDADLVLDNEYTSRTHARITASADGGAIVEDLNSANGTFVNRSPVHAATRMEVGDELLVGVTVITLRGSESEPDRKTTQVRMIPPLLAAHPPAPRDLPAPPERPATSEQMRELERLLDVNTRFRASTAPLAVVILVALVVAVYLGAR